MSANELFVMAYKENINMKEINVKKILLHAYMFWVSCGLIPLVGVGMASMFETMYEVFTFKWLALILISFFFGSIATVLPLYLMLEPSLRLLIRNVDSLRNVVIIGWIAAIIVPLLGFEYLSIGLIVIIYLTTFPSLEELSSGLRNKSD